MQIYYRLFFLIFLINNQVIFSIKEKNFGTSTTEIKSYRQNVYAESIRKSRNDNKNTQLCDEDQLMIYLAEIDAINPESIINLVTVEDMESMCLKVTTNLERMNCYLKHCEPPEQKDLYVQLIRGVNVLHEKLCAPCPFKCEFEKYFECIQDLHEDFKQCTGPPDWTEYCTTKEVCKAYKKIIDCYYIKTAMLCGLKAAHLFKELGMDVIDKIIDRSCKIILKDPIVKKPMPEEYVCSGISCVPSFLFTMSFTHIVIFIINL